MRVWTATTPEQLRDIADLIHDAYFDPDRVEHDEAAGTVVVAFAQEAGPWDELPQDELVGRSLLASTYRVPFMRGAVTVRNVTAVEAEEDWGDMGMLHSLDFDAGRSELTFASAAERLRVTVSVLRVEAELSAEIEGYVRRRVGRLLPIETDRPWS